MKLAIPQETRPHETRVAASPETVKKLIGLGLEVAVQAGAGAGSRFSDKDYQEAGATICQGAATTLQGAGLVFKVQPPTSAEVADYPQSAMVLSCLYPHRHQEDIKAAMAKGLSLFAMEWVPRITRAQSMDVLSSQANLAGYRAVIEAAAMYEKGMPMMMTAAGTVAPAKVMVLGAGVAGLQAIATARRMGAVVCGTDVRPAAKEQVKSLGATFVMVQSEETAQAETAGGYAKEMSEDYRQKQAALVAETLKKQDIAICTALIPGRKAPTLISADMVRSMKPGSIIIDMAVEEGGNCELSKPGEIVDVDGVRVFGLYNLPGRIASDASALYARNLLKFAELLVKPGEGFAPDWNDEILVASLAVKDGQVAHERLKEAGLG